MRAEDDSADRGDEQHDGGDLEGQQVVAQEESPDVARAAEGAGDVVGMGEPSAGLQPDHDDDLHEQSSCRQYCSDRLPTRPAGPWRFGARPDVGDDEQEHDHHRAGVDEHLRGRHELGGEQ